MFKHYLIAWIQEIIEMLQKHPDFFKKEERDKILEAKKLSLPYKKYLQEVSEKEFLKDLQLILHYSREPQKTTVEENAFFKAFIQFLTTAFAVRIDLMKESFGLNEEQKKEIGEKLIPGKEKTSKELKKILMVYSYQEILSEITKLNQKIQKAPYLVIQSPRDIDIELKKEIREALKKENSTYSPIFQINSKLIGGLRLFKDGENLDYSWIARVLQFTSLTH